MESKLKLWGNFHGRTPAAARKNRKKGGQNSLVRHLVFESLEVRQMLAIDYTVNVDFDENDGVGDGQVSLRDAVFAATSGQTIGFEPTLLNAATILQSLGEITIDKNLTIDASMLTSGLTIDAGGGINPSIGNGDGFRIFDIVDTSGGLNPPEVTLISMKLTGGDVSDNGGAIRSAGILTLQDMNVFNNSAQSGGGAVATSSSWLLGMALC